MSVSAFTSPHIERFNKLFLLIAIVISSCNTLTEKKFRSCELDGFFSDSDSCSAYYLCKDGLLYYLSCGYEQHFNPFTAKCERKDDQNCKLGQTVYFPYSIRDVENVMENKSSSFKSICFMSNWKYCENADNEENKEICNKACDAFEILNTENSDNAKSPCHTKPWTKEKEDFKIICYFAASAVYRKGKGKFLPENIDPSLCTHIVYAAAGLDNNSLTITSLDPNTDFDKGFYKKVTDLKSKGVKVSLVVGTWADSKSDKYSRMVSSPENRKKFIDNAIKGLELYGFDGLEFDWQYPVCWNNDCSRGPSADKDNFLALLKELHAAFKPKGLLLSSIISRREYIIDAAYELEELSKYLDWMSVSCHYYFTHLQGKTGHVAALYQYDGGEHLNINYSIHTVLSKGADKSKLIMALPFFGNRFTLENEEEHGLNAHIIGPGEEGEYTKSENLYSFYEICDRVKEKEWTVVRDPTGVIGPYAYKGNQWTSYDDIAEMKRKVKYAKKNGLGGVYVWNLANDDFRDTCECGKYPLLKAVNQEVRGYPHLKDFNLENCT